MVASLTRKQLDRLPKEILQWDDDAPLGPMELTGAYYERGHSEGRKEGRLLEARKVLQRVLDRRGLHLDDAQRKRIDACEQLEQLEQWLDRALTVNTAAAVLDPQ